MPWTVRRTVICMGTCMSSMMSQFCLLVHRSTSNFDCCIQAQAQVRHFRHIQAQAPSHSVHVSKRLCSDPINAAASGDVHQEGRRDDQDMSGYGIRAGFMCRLLIDVPVSNSAVPVVLLRIHRRKSLVCYNVCSQAKMGAEVHIFISWHNR